MPQPLNYLRETAVADRRPLRPHRPRPGRGRASSIFETRARHRHRRAEREGRADHASRASCIDGTGAPVKDVLIEVWQANAAGIYAAPADRRAGRGRGGLPRLGPGRSPTSTTGLYAFETVKPGVASPGRGGRPMAPHLNLWIVARGINIGLNTRMYFDDEAEANAADPVLNLIEQVDRRATLIAPREDARRQAGLSLRHPPPGRRRDGVLRCLSHASKPCIICVAITGRLPTQGEQPGGADHRRRAGRESTQEAFEAGATIVHCHVRNDDETPTSDPERFGRLLEGLRRHCPGLIVQLSTGGRSGAGRERGGMLSLAARHGLALGRLEQLPDPGLREQPRSGRLARRPRC